jgi:hypothetical protein
MDLKVYGAYIDPSLDSDLEVQCIGLVDRPAIERNFLAFKETAAQFAVNEDRRILVGPIMIADTPIYRNDNTFGEYYVTFDKASVRTIAKKFAARGFMQKFNFFHDNNAAAEKCTLYSSFITDATLGIHAPDAFKDVPDGSWFGCVSMDNDVAWDAVKTGKIKGFSVEGFFEYLPLKLPEKMEEAPKKDERSLVQKLIDLVNQTDLD